MALTKAFPRMMEGVPISVKDFGAVGDGVTDDTAAIQAALDAAKGADATATGRSVFSLYFPSTEGGFYKITDTLVIDGTHGLTIFGDGARKERSGSVAAIIWYGSSQKPIFQLAGRTGIPSNPNFLITIRDLTLSGYESSVTPGSSIPSTVALSGIHLGNLDEENDNTLQRMVLIENVNIENCRFGIWSGNPDGLNTDHASTGINHCYIRNNFQAGIKWGTGNAIVSIHGCTLSGNGWGSTNYPADDYSGQVGANIYQDAGYVDISSYVSAGAGTSQPDDACIYQGNGRISIINAWSDTHGIFYQQAAASVNAGGSQVAMVTGVRHYEGTMTSGNTPTSMVIRVPGTVVSSCQVYGDIEVQSGLSGRPVFQGINFSTGSGFTGTGIDTQRSLINIGNSGNNAQILMGGTNSASGETLTHDGSLPPQLLSVGTGAVGTGQTHSLMQWKGATSGSSSGTWGVSNFVDGSVEYLLNCYFQSPNYIVENSSYPAMRIIMGTTQGVNVQVYDPSGGTTFSSGDWVDSTRTLIPTAAGNREESAFRFPLRSGDPGYTSGDFWEGSVYYNTTTNKLRVNVGGSTWQDLN